VHPFIVVYEGRDIGMMAWERMGDFPELQHLYGIEDPDSANCDVLIGEGDAAHRGLGAALIRAFLTREVFADRRITSCVIDPMIDNGIAIRAYEKAGFRFCRVAPDDGDGHALYLMELRREEMSRPPADPGPAHLRPARETEIALASEIDDDACKAFDDLGLTFSSQIDQAFVAAEFARWSEATRASRMLMACAEGRVPVGFSAVGYVDGRPYVHQLSVRRAWARRGIGRLLLERAALELPPRRALAHDL
jgi:GNAT superfamily N-acetyltransferase